MRYRFLQIGFILVITILIAAMGAKCQIQSSAEQSSPHELTAKEAYNRLLNISMEMAYIDTMISLSDWDQDISMPPNATEYRAIAQGYMEDLKNKKYTDPEFGRLLSIACNGSNWSVVEAANLRLWNRDYSKRIKLPSDFAARESETTSLAQAAWEEAREKNNYSIFKPHLRAVVELNREKAEYLGYRTHPYDALLDDFMPGTTTAKIDKLFGAIKPEIIDLIKKIKESNETAAKNIYGNNTYPREKQEELVKNITIALGYDYGSGLMAKTERHPSTYSIGKNDTRTGLSYDVHNPESAILDAIHETGHGIAYQKVPEEYYGMPIGTIISIDTAEAESRLFENNFGRSFAFWQYWLLQMKKEFRPEMDNVSLDDIYRHVNRLNIVPIRVDADEVSYILHIIIRYEIERDLFDGKVSVDELPAVWSQKYKDYLGVNITDDSEGLLQDPHWAIGYFGYFPAYALASMNAAQLDASMRRDYPDLDQRFASGDFSVPVLWMQEHIYKYGSIYNTTELMKKATGNETEPYDFLKYLNGKYKKLYNLK